MLAKPPVCHRRAVGCDHTQLQQKLALTCAEEGRSLCRSNLMSGPIINTRPGKKRQAGRKQLH